VRFINKRDVGILGVIIVTALFFYVFNAAAGNDAECFARITVDGQTVQETELSESRTVEISQRPGIRIEVRNGTVGFTSSDCPDQTCVHSGFLHRPGQMAVCLPNRTALIIVSGENTRTTDEVDAVAY
jgi:hypothetical protein